MKVSRHNPFKACNINIRVGSQYEEKSKPPCHSGAGLGLYSFQFTEYTLFTIETLEGPILTTGNTWDSGTHITHTQYTCPHILVSVTSVLHQGSKSSVVTFKSLPEWNEGRYYHCCMKIEEWMRRVRYCGQAPRCTVHRSLMVAHLAIDKNLAIFLLLLQVDKQHLWWW